MAWVVHRNRSPSLHRPFLKKIETDNHKPSGINPLSLRTPKSVSPNSVVLGGRPFGFVFANRLTPLTKTDISRHREPMSDCQRSARAYLSIYCHACAFGARAAQHATRCLTLSEGSCHRCASFWKSMFVNRERSVPTPASCESLLMGYGFKQLDGVTIRVFDLDLSAPWAGFHGIAESHAGGLHLLDTGGQIADLKDQPVPSAWFLLSAIGHRAGTGTPGAAQKDGKPADRDFRKGRGLLKFQFALHRPRVEGDGSLDVADLISESTHLHLTFSRGRRRRFGTLVAHGVIIRPAGKSGHSAVFFGGSWPGSGLEWCWRQGSWSVNAPSHPGQDSHSSK